MSVFEQIKTRLDIAEIAGRYTELSSHGRNGRMRGLCPLHSEDTPSFFVFGDTQRWHCFGCDRGGDVFDLYEELQGVDTQTALRELAREAGVQLTPLTPEQQAAQTRQRQREEIFGVAIAHWQAAIRRPNAPGMAYAEGRGWDAETIESAGLGYHRDAQPLRAALQRAGVDLNDEAAQAVLRTPPHSLIYPHFWRGRAVYFAARGIEDKRHWNPPADLIGPRQPYYNHHYTPRADTVIVVEGQGDGVSVGHWDRAGVATAGTAVDDDLIQRLRKHKTVYIGVENNEAGRMAARKLAAELGAMARLVYWPFKEMNDGSDANDYLMTGAGSGDLEVLLARAPSWLDILIDEAVTASPADAQETLRAVFAALVHVDQFALTKIQDEVCKALDLTKSTFAKFLQMARMDAGMDQHGRPLYEIIGGQICRRIYDRYGGETINPLAKFSAEIVEDVVEDDGLEQTRYFVVEAKLPDGSPLPPARVKASDFSKMGWILEEWGSQAMVMAGRGTSDHLRAAIQTLSGEVEHRHEYSHLGWREIGGEMCYLTSAGAVGKPDIPVRLHPDFKRYSLPPTIEGEDRVGAVRASLRFLEIGDLHITIPLWAAMYLAPLASVLPPTFTLWLFGTTGSMKSTAAALAMCHYGEFSYNLPAPGSWMSSTTYALRVKAFVAKDAPLWVDDYAKQSTRAGERELRKMAETLLREWGNRSGRSAGQADGSLRQTHDPRGLVISTAEQLPPSQSILPRLYAVEMHPGDVSHGQESNLTRAQNNDATRYPIAMVSYLNWLAPQLEDLHADLRERKHQLTQDARKSMTQHLRSPANVATLAVGWEMGLRHAHEIGALNRAEYEGWLSMGWDTLIALGEQQDSDINAEEDPVKMYVTAIQQMMSQGTIYLRHKDTGEEKPSIDKHINNPEFLGWYDDRYWYLMDQPTFNAVFQFYRSGGRSFPDSRRGIKTKLSEQNILFPHAGRGNLYRLRLEDGLEDVLRILRPDKTEE
jgi:hypothetical protein